MFEWIVLISLGLLWGASYLFIKVGVQDIPPLTFVAGRTLIASVVLVAAGWARHERWPERTWRAWAPLFALGLFNSVIPYTLITWGELEISSGLAAILTASMPIFTVLFAHFMTQDEKLNMGKGAGIVLGFVGVAVIFLPELSQGVKLSLVGMLAVLLAASSYGFATIIAHRSLSNTSHLVASVGQLGTAALMLLPVSLLLDHPWTLRPTLPALGALAALSLVGTAIAYLMYYWLIDKIGATRTSVVTYISPFGGLVLGAVILNEQAHPLSLLGLILIVAGVLLVNRKTAESADRMEQGEMGRAQTSATE